MGYSSLLIAHFYHGKERHPLSPSGGSPDAPTQIRAAEGRSLDLTLLQVP